LTVEWLEVEDDVSDVDVKEFELQDQIGVT
jgi:hypothetical protein